MSGQKSEVCSCSQLMTRGEQVKKQAVRESVPGQWLPALFIVFFLLVFYFVSSIVMQSYTRFR